MYWLKVTYPNGSVEQAKLFDGNQKSIYLNLVLEVARKLWLAASHHTDDDIVCTMSVYYEAPEPKLPF